MIDLAILLSISLAVTALLGLLLIGFVWVPWLIGLLLLVLLVVLMKITAVNEQQTAMLPEQMSNAQQTPHSTSDEAFGSTEGSVMVYRGAKYKRPSEVNDSPAPITQGKYRGQPWSR